MMRKLCKAIAVALMSASANGTAQDAAVKPFTPEQIKKGASLYATNCEACHGVRMIGPPWGSDLTTFPRDNRARFVDSVTHGKNTMPPWGDVLSAEDIAALWTYVVAGEQKN